MTRSSPRRTPSRPPGQRAIVSWRPTLASRPIGRGVGGPEQRTRSSRPTVAGTTPCPTRRRRTGGDPPPDQGPMVASVLGDYTRRWRTIMTKTPALPVYVHAPHLMAQALVRTAKSGIYLVRGVPRDLQRSARARAARETTTLSSVLR